MRQGGRILLTDYYETPFLVYCCEREEEVGLGDICDGRGGLGGDREDPTKKVVDCAFGGDIEVIEERSRRFIVVAERDIYGYIMLAVG